MTIEVSVDEYREVICQEYQPFHHVDPQTLVFTRFTAGLTNMVYAVEDPESGLGVVLRVFGSIEFGSRDFENKVCTLIGNAHIAPKLYYANSEWRIEEFIRGGELNTVLFREDPEIQARSMETLAEFHKVDATEIMEISEVPWCIETIKTEINHLEILEEQNEKLAAFFPSEDKLFTEIEWLHQQLLKLDTDGSNKVFCHNDYRPANIINAIDGKLHAVDFDTVGYNYRGYDIGRALNAMYLNVTKEGCEWVDDGYPPEHVVHHMLVAYLTQYLNRPPTPEEIDHLENEVVVGNLAALLHLSLWSGEKSCRSDGHGWNYSQYSQDRLFQYYRTKAEYFGTSIPPQFEAYHEM